MKSAPHQQTLTPSLSINDLIFVNAYFASDRSAVQAYRASHPKAKYSTCKVEAYRVLAKPSVQAEIAKRVQADAGITREYVQSNLMHALALANAANDAAVIASVTMDCAKLAGFLIEKREIKTMSEEQSDHVRRIVASALSQPN